MKKDKDKSKKWLVLGVIFLVILAIGIIVLVLQYVQRNKANSSMEDLKKAANELDGSDKSEEDDVLAKLGIKIPEKNLDWDALHKECEDIYAWIYVPDTTVDYPIVQHPTDNAYYLNHNLDGSKGYPGTIYTEDYNSKDFTDPHTVIYGHNLKDKTMFSSLHNFEDSELVNIEHYIFIYTEDYVYVYEIFGAYEFLAIHLLANYDLDNEYVYEQYIKDIFNVENTTTRVANIRHDISVTKDDQIVTLSTCTTDHNSEIRFLVVGVLLNPQE